jgi:hypothetical protein
VINERSFMTGRVESPCRSTGFGLRGWLSSAGDQRQRQVARRSSPGCHRAPPAAVLPQPGAPGNAQPPSSICNPASPAPDARPRPPRPPSKPNQTDQVKGRVKRPERPNDEERNAQVQLMQDEIVKLINRCARGRGERGCTSSIRDQGAPPPGLGLGPLAALPPCTRTHMTRPRFLKPFQLSLSTPQTSVHNSRSPSIHPPSPPAGRSRSRTCWTASTPPRAGRPSSRSCGSSCSSCAPSGTPCWCVALLVPDFCNNCTRVTR